MDPLTLFALANGAVSAVKAGCKLYKDIKGAAGDVKDVLKDLDTQFKKLHPPDRPPTAEQKQQYIKEKTRIIELNKKAEQNEHNNIYADIGDYLGKYYDNYYKCIAVFEAEEKRANTQVYKGDDSLGKRALQRVLMRKQLEQMSVELRELMVYQSPPELGSLYTDVEKMMKEMGKQQKSLIAQQIANDRRRQIRKKAEQERLYLNMLIGLGGVVVFVAIGLLFVWVVHDRIEKYPHLGTDWIPKTAEQKQQELDPKIYTGR